MRYLTFVFFVCSLFFFSHSAFAKDDKYIAALNNNLAFKEAMSYVTHVENRNIEVGAEAIDKDGMKRLFGNNTGKYIPFNIAVTNNSKFRIYINQISIKQGNDGVLPFVDLHEVLEAIDPGGRGNKDDMRDAALRNNLINKALPHTVLSPGETIQGVVFVRAKSYNKSTQLFLQIQNLKRIAYLDFAVDLDGGKS
ncbi:MAG: hypothetical protein COA43_05860 [Robiginitomaculum sp.]|nr:MAG: hypothetical protein COA43_05860 [Robiginitomaculum sp.]